MVPRLGIKHQQTDPSMTVQREDLEVLVLQLKLSSVIHSATMNLLSIN
jgi:hypothetical protein